MGLKKNIFFSLWLTVYSSCNKGRFSGSREYKKMVMLVGGFGSREKNVRDFFSF